MPAINFKPEFALAVMLGIKKCTIRRDRNIKAGDRLYFYTRQRTKNCVSLGDAICTRIIPVVIGADYIQVKAEPTTTRGVDAITTRGNTLLDQIARGDGFEKWEDFAEFFRRHYELPFNGIIICWGEVQPASRRLMEAAASRLQKSGRKAGRALQKLAQELKVKK